MSSFYWFLAGCFVGGTAATILYGILVIASLNDE